MDEFGARAIVLSMAFLELGVIVFAGFFRERLGWKSLFGQMIWLVLGCPGTLTIWVAQQVIYRKITGQNPFDDIVAATTIIVGGVVTAIALFYYVFRNRYDSEDRKR
jgi:hypothetical protein